MLVEPLDGLTLIYHRRSGVTHMVVEPVPQILAAMGEDALTLDQLLTRLSKDFDLGDAVEAKAVLAARIDELVDLGLVDKLDGQDA
ncbi:MAG: HPr-rel-A system PqqD family peptide chaperone [Sphingomonadales bacterium]|nr:HPr-rel-A system PqqD family peptide chaperone [Sphingomonadales bacterium]MBK9431083.1 HPr-rel-A system PqqD family peptide chaperone [Sphingomonadales bacterium]MBL0021218.1 HPr-rel-A system PqqD family peptide chaperone [Sphingomonadales bacterium]